MKNRESHITLGVIGIGARSMGLLGVLAEMPDVKIVAISDLAAGQMEKGADTVHTLAGYRPLQLQNHRELLAIGGLQGVVIGTSWNEHIPLAIESMRAGKYTAFEVGGASSTQQCWDLVKTHEETGAPCMMLENCCYGRYELGVLNMIRQGLFGTVVHCEGGYRHDLRMESLGLEAGHQRSFHHLKRNGELYPTHEIGPIAKYLGINRGNRFLTLSSTASASHGLSAAYDQGGMGNHPAPHPARLGDVTTTVLKCALGQTVTITHDVSLPRPYSRANVVCGTRGIWMEINNGIFLDGVSPEGEYGMHPWESMDGYLERYEHPIWKAFLNDGVTGGHGGMDYLVLRAFVHSIRQGIATPIDVYDAASWMAITALSEASVALGGMPMPFPDFTNGRWVQREAAPKSPYSLDE